MDNDYTVEIWTKIIQEDQKHKKETGWSYFNPQNESEEEVC